MDMHIKVLADRYLKGQCTPAEAKQVLDWLETEAGQIYLAVCLEEDQHLLDDPNLFLLPVAVPSGKMFDAILENLTQPDNSELNFAPATESKLAPAPETKKPGWLRQKGWYQIAAVLLVGILSAAWLQKYYLAGQTLVYTTNYGETARIVLPDSSTVTLNGNSRIAYANNWNRRQAREVQLQGEAYFSVIHKKDNQKFWVTTSDNIKVEVLGTEFNVSDREGKTQVVLASGKVRLDLNSHVKKATSVVMQPGESVEISARKDTLLRRRVDPAVFTSWKNDKLLFDNTSVREICKRLEDTYGYQVEVDDPTLLQQRITGSVPNQSIEVVLDGLQSLLEVKVTKSTHVIRITPLN
jgi:ferric-dicitrate binding protein FerR (iron transport regulator)